MKLQTLPVKRRPVPKGVFRRLSAVTRSRKQRVAASASPSSLPEIETDDGSSKISRALTIIFLIHIVAIGLIFVHQRFLDGRPAEKTETIQSLAAPAPAVSEENVPRLSGGEVVYAVRAGDNYARIAAARSVDEGDLRQLNGDVEIRPGLLLKIPPQRIVAEEPPEVAAIREQSVPDHDRGLVENVDVSHAPKAQLVRPNVAQPQPSPAAALPAASGQSYVVQPGDSVWRIANRFKVDQNHLMRANGISDAKKMKAGMKLVIPQS